jgi:alanine racemase
MPLSHTKLLIHLDHIRHNLDYFRSFLKSTTKLMALVKGNAYGHGAAELSLSLERMKLADYLGVAFPCEGIELRKAGVTLPIVVLTPGTSSFSELIDYQIYPEIANFEALQIYIQTVKQKGLTQVPFHLALDTGMHRVGFEPDHIPQLVNTLKNNSSITPISVFSHLAAADEAQHDLFTQSQINLFTKMCEQVCAALPQQPILHLLNSPGTERFPYAQFDMVRIGIGMYGTSAVDQSRLKNPSTFCCPIIQIKEVPFGESVGYGRHGKTTDGAKTTATLPVGYADGVDRHLGRGKAKFLVNGVLAPTIGNICMDMCMIDITGIPAAQGDMVTLFGAPPAHSALDWAKILDTISYEIYTSVAQRVQRVYI